MSSTQVVKHFYLQAFKDIKWNAESNQVGLDSLLESFSLRHSVIYKRRLLKICEHLDMHVANPDYSHIY